jgi:hypothetical protein
MQFGCVIYGLRCFAAKEKKLLVSLTYLTRTGLISIVPVCSISLQYNFTLRAADENFFLL